MKEALSEPEWADAIRVDTHTAALRSRATSIYIAGRDMHEKIVDLLFEHGGGPKKKVGYAPFWKILDL